jgi:formamidopyrimidine-DNA glycosylase
MIEIPEAYVIAQQLNLTVPGKVIRSVITAQSPHKFAWYSGDPAGYGGMLTGKTMGKSASLGGLVEIQVYDMDLLFGDGINLRFHQSKEEQPLKHQLLIEFEDSTSISGTVAMYGGMWCFTRGSFDNPYHQGASVKPSPLGDGFDFNYFTGLFLPGLEKYSLKAFLATEQRIPGLGNGVLQDILFRAKYHPKRKVNTLDSLEKENLFNAIKATLREMVRGGGRDTERDLFGNSGGYITLMSKNTIGKACTVCGTLIQKQAYMGGSIYFCPNCQKE